MIQLIINGNILPETSHDKYKAYRRELGEDLRAINGTHISEIRAYIWVVEYSYDYIRDQALAAALLSDLTSNAELDVSFLVPYSPEMRQAMFTCTQKPVPTYAFSKKDRAYYHNMAFTLEAIKGDINAALF